MFTAKVNDSPEQRQAAALEEIARNSSAILANLQHIAKALSEIQKSNQSIANSALRQR
ncbi:hypothetical protein [Sinimarinibacterium flocculans]|uniref:Uncharacterized protein n=1 Tax=Sinimarinibacterium flocculans TaxID=985250 RepID=A0A318E6B8_9GAMM|nr:hypothetical protein [Sinimarinibacterium flocculans]PXV67042.1 hypothetical protein C8D93_10615 [Sinimarinibacterium flocculans]